MDDTDLGDLSPAAFRAYGHRLIEWIADYLEHPERYPVLAQVEPGEVRAQLPAAPPAAAEPMDAILRDFERVILPGITHWNHPGFFAYFAITGSVPGILGELLSAALNINGMLWRTSPAATELEELALDWLRQMLGLPSAFRGVIMDTASVASLVAIAAARERLGLGVREDGMAGKPRLRLYASDQAHSSIEKAAITLGLGQRGVRAIPADREYRIDPAVLAAAVRDDRAEGWLPFCAVATVGTTSSTSIDPVPAIADVCAREGLWLHVDAAYGGVAAIVPELRRVLDGCDRADSLVTNPHKWLFTPIDCSAFYTRHVDVLTRAFSLVPEYLRTAGSTIDTPVVNYMDWGIQLGRRFRALKLWMVIRAFGVEGLAARIREHVRLGRLFASWVDDDPLFERLAPVPFSTVCFRAVFPRTGSRDAVDPRADETAVEALNERLLAAINATGEAYLSHTRLKGDWTSRPADRPPANSVPANGRYALRLAVGNLRTTEDHVARVWELLRAAARDLIESA